ncbi:MAG: ATP-binding cassette domain-containing protein [Syntrophobacteraceae bacterium]
MALISIRDATLGLGGALLFDHINIQIERGERVCLLGRNGAGKSTLMRVIHGEASLDEGTVILETGAKAAMLPQEAPEGIKGSSYEVVASGLNGLSASGEQMPHEGAEWRMRQQVEMAMSRMDLDPEARFESLSAGLKRRVLLARGLVRDPDLLLLDEPTNHLDIVSITRMEDFLLRYGGTLLFVTHDRTFLRKLATRIIELDRGRIIDWACGYDEFLKRRQAVLEAEEEQWRQFDKKLAREETWIRQGIKARRTRNEGRVRELEKMREARRARRERTGSVRMRAQDAERSGKLIIEAEGVSYGYAPERPIVQGFSTTIMRGDRIGVIGPNGAGKTTLLRLLLGELKPLEGEVRHGVHLDIAYFDQLREQLDPEKSVIENVGEGNDTIIFDGKPRHIIGYLQDFLFSPDRARSPVRILSGGERNRLLLARLFIKPANVLVMDEPTNDLDAETLELLEDLLLDYSGTLLLVSHDRSFLNNVVTSVLAMEGEGKVGEYVGGYDDWIRQRTVAEAVVKTGGAPAKVEKPRSRQEGRRKLGFKEQRELEALPQRIEELESLQKEMYGRMADPSFYQQDGASIAAAKAALERMEEELEEMYLRWEELEVLSNG